MKSNIMLNELDKELEAKRLWFVRYADDCIVLVECSKAWIRSMVIIMELIEIKI